MGRESKQRWKDRGFPSFEACTGYFRRLWQHALRNGLKPGDPIVFGRSELLWLVQGHPAFAQMKLRGFSHFTLQPEGRGNYRFVFVDAVGKEHPFSTRTALTGFVDYPPLRGPLDDDDPLGGLAT